MGDTWTVDVYNLCKIMLLVVCGLPVSRFPTH